MKKRFLQPFDRKKVFPSTWTKWPLPEIMPTNALAYFSKVKIIQNKFYKIGLQESDKSE